MAVLTGGHEEIGRKLDSVTVQDFGSARRVVATKDDTTIGAGSKDQIKARMRSRPRSRTPRPTTTRRTRGAPRQALAVWASSRSARPPRSSSRRRSTGWTPSPPPGPPSKRASSPAAALALLQAIPALDLVELGGRGRGSRPAPRARSTHPPDADNAGAARRSRRRARGSAASRAIGYDALKGDGDMFKDVDAAKVTRSALQNAASIAAMVHDDGDADRRPAPRRSHSFRLAAAVMAERHGLLNRPPALRRRTFARRRTAAYWPGDPDARGAVAWSGVAP